MAPKTVLLKGDPIRKEAIAGGAITPGHLVDFDNNGALVVHATAGGDAAPRFAIEEEFIGDGIDTAYAAGDQVQYVIARPGDEIYAILAAGQQITIGMALESAGNGTLRAHTQPVVDVGAAQDYSIATNAIVGYALENVTTVAAVARIKIEAA